MVKEKAKKEKGEMLLTESWEGSYELLLWLVGVGCRWSGCNVLVS